MSRTLIRPLGAQISQLLRNRVFEKDGRWPLCPHKSRQKRWLVIGQVLRACSTILFESTENREQSVSLLQGLLLREPGEKEKKKKP